eukprot:TRINITY_DN9557_c0_g1_i2.p1 TRINITY_DN9557_c0_g1~~TRINITY_DN9557_c0_g1_i2.p1  ORF type:complete len:167 (-),score=27.07 TRINITY_DN9557_c0_g1_i2:644-1144(-)
MLLCILQYLMHTENGMIRLYSVTLIIIGDTFHILYSVYVAFNYALFVIPITKVYTTCSTYRQCVIAREMTKWHEEFWRGSLAEAKSEFSQRNPKGEITLLIHGAPETSSESPSEAELETELQALLSKGHSLSEGVKIIAEQFGVRKKAVYAMALKMHSGKWDIEDS